MCKRIVVLLAVVCMIVLLSACGKKGEKKPVTETPTAPAPSAEATPVPTETPTLAPTLIPTLTPTPTPSPTPTPIAVPEGYSDTEVIKKIQEEVENATLTYRREEVIAEGPDSLLSVSGGMSEKPTYDRILTYFDAEGTVKLMRYFEDDREVMRRLIGKDGVCLCCGEDVVLEKKTNTISITDENGNLIKQYDVRGNDVMQYREYTYYENGILKEAEEQEYPIDGYASERREKISRYDENGRIVSIKETAKSPITVYGSRYEINAQGIVSVTSTSLGFGNSAETNYTYSEGGNLYTKTINGANGKEYKEEYRYEIDSKGRIWRIRKNLFLNGEPFTDNEYVYEFTYYSNGPVLVTENAIVLREIDNPVAFQAWTVFLPGTELKKKLTTASGFSYEKFDEELNNYIRIQEESAFGIDERYLFTPVPYRCVQSFPATEGRILLIAYKDGRELAALKEFPMNKLWNENGRKEGTWFGANYVFEGDYLTECYQSAFSYFELKVEYDSKKPVKTVTSYGGGGSVSSDFQYDSSGRLTRFETKRNFTYGGKNEARYILQYVYDNNGNLKKINGEMTRQYARQSDDGSNPLENSKTLVTVEPYTGNGEE